MSITSPTSAARADVTSTLISPIPSAQLSMTPTGQSSVACLACRQKHAKCDGRSPCDRCQSEGCACEFVTSNRGYRSDRRKRPRRLEGDAISISAQPVGPVTTTEERVSLSRPPSAPWQRCRESTAATDPQGLDEEAIDLYFANFHNSHPILTLPRFAPSSRWGCLLRGVVVLIGSCYAHDAARDLKQARFRVEEALSNELDQSAERVQALLLYSIALHGRAEPQLACSRLEEAVALALHLNLNDELSIRYLACDQPMPAESNRRTWWELVGLDILFAALFQRPPLLTDQLQITTRIPCQDDVFACGDCTIDGNAPIHLLDNRVFGTPEQHLSSAAFRIEAHRILSRVLANTLDSYPSRSEDSAQGLDAALSSWEMSLPQEKIDVIDASGGCDEMLFQTRMIIFCSSIYLHVPRSTLTTSSPVGQHIVCARRAPRTKSLGRQHAHTCKTIAAAKNLSVLASLGADIQRRSPFFICSLVLSAVVHLSAYKLRADADATSHKDRVAQSVGLLRSLAKIWPMAEVVLDQVRAAAVDILQANGSSASAMSAHDPTAVVGSDSLIDLLGSTFFADVCFESPELGSGTLD